MCSSSETVGGFPPCASQPLARSLSTLHSDYTQSWAVSPRMEGVGWGQRVQPRCPPRALNIWDVEQGMCTGRGACLAASPSGGRCAAASASLPAGTPCLSGPGAAPRWKDKGQGETRGPPGPGRVPEEREVQDTLGEARKEPALLPDALYPESRSAEVDGAAAACQRPCVWPP